MARKQHANVSARIVPGRRSTPAADARQARATPKIYPLIRRALAEARAPLSTREIFNRLALPGIKAHDVSKALNNLTHHGHVTSFPDPALGRRALRWSIAASVPAGRRPASRKPGTEPVFHYTPTGALTIVTDSIAVVVPVRVVPKLRAFLAGQGDSATAACGKTPR